jgi:bifunctional NMN adenylyltransferase/nudix hydrolase
MKNYKNVGVIIGRFQTPYLHEGHKQFINIVKSKCDLLIIFIGTSRPRLARKNPLPYEVRKHMIIDEVGNHNVIVEVLEDHQSDDYWSNNLDTKIKNILSSIKSKEENPTYDITLYGSRDSFIPYYKGIHTTELIQSTQKQNATALRKRCYKNIVDDLNWRSGIIYASNLRYPGVFPTVDIAVINEHQQVLLGRKPGEPSFRFIGGFVDPTDDSYEAAAKREAREEAGDLELGKAQYIGSYKIDDWRYRNDVDKIITTFYQSQYIFGQVKAGDDLEEVKWFNYSELKNLVVMEVHTQLLQEFIKFNNIGV